MLISTSGKFQFVGMNAGTNNHQDNRSNEAVEIDNAYVMIYYHQQKEAVFMRTNMMPMMYMYTIMYDRTSYGIDSAQE